MKVNDFLQRVYQNLLYQVLPDKLFLEGLYFIAFGKKLNLKNPRTFNEKIQWLKLYNRCPQYTIMVDKAAVKEYVANIIGDQYLIPTYGVWDKFDEIDFESLPNQFVLKTTHDSGGIVICKDKENFDKKTAKKKLTRSLKRNYYSRSKEWAYKNVKPRIMAEKFMEDKTTPDLKDWKIFCFDGDPKFLFVASDRFTPNEETKFDFYDIEFNHLPFTNGHPNSDTPIERPKAFDEMIECAKKLSKGYPHIRTDFYEINGKVYFGELTLCHYSGLVPFKPEPWDEELGKFIKLPKKQQ